MPSLQVVLNSIQLIGLMAITGGTITIGALTAPILFQDLNREEAGSVMIDIFTKFDGWIKFSAGILFAAKVIEIIYVHKFSFMKTEQLGDQVVSSLNTGLLISTLLVFAVAAVSYVISFKLSPQILESYNNDSPQFIQLHQRSELLHKLNFVLGLILLIGFSAV